MKNLPYAVDRADIKLHLMIDIRLLTPPISLSTPTAMVTSTLPSASGAFKGTDRE